MKQLNKYLNESLRMSINKCIPIMSESLRIGINDEPEPDLPEYINILTNPKVQWKSYWNRAVTEAKIWGELCSAINNLKEKDGRGNATKESPTLFTLSEKGRPNSINAGKPLAQKIFAGNDVFYIKPLKPGYKKSGIEISRRELDPRESGKFDGALATGRWEIDKDVAVSAEGYAVYPDLVEALNTIMEGEQ